MSNFRILLDLEVAELTPEQIRDAIYRDHLTGIWNRRALESHPLFEADGTWVALVDLDSLKWINDYHGHAAGDEAIRKLGQWLKARFGDRAFRISGDEFVVISTDRAELDKLNGQRCFTAAVGRTLKDADQALNNAKMERTISGVRAARGEAPVWARRTNR